MITLLSSLTPDTAVLLLSLGLVLIAVELNRPGAILPGALGLLVALLACASLAHDHPDPLAIGLLVSAAGILLLQSHCGIPLWVSCLATAAGIVGFARIVPGIHLATAILCGLTLGVGTTLLTRIAHRARRNKGLD
jgi:membrane-bound serine protease (ClpP class)